MKQVKAKLYLAEIISMIYWMKNRDKYLHLQKGKLLHLSFSNAAMKLFEQDENNFSETLRCLLLGHIRTSCMDLQEPARRSLWLNRSSKCGRIIRNPGSSLQLRVTAQLTAWTHPGKSAHATLCAVQDGGWHHPRFVSAAIWPDSAKFRHFGNILKSIRAIFKSFS